MADGAKLRWAVRRLAAMTPAEVAVRAVRATRNRFRRPGAPVGPVELASLERVLDPREVRGGETAESAIRSALDESRGTLLPGARETAGVADELGRMGTSTARVVAAADAVLAGSLPVFGWTTYETAYPPDWHVDPTSGKRWPLDYWAELDFRFEPGLDEPRYIWEINRQHELVTFGRAYALTGDERYAEAVWESMRSWAERNPPFFGINWTSALEVSIRLVSWAFAIDLVGTVGATDSDVRTVLSSAALQAAHLSDNLSVYASSRNNHLIGEAAGLMVVGAKFPFLRGASRWLASGLGHLEREVVRQVTVDGVPKEQALHYGAFVIEFVLVASAALRTRGAQLGAPVRKRLARMAAFLGAVASDEGVVPEIGDADGGRAFELSDAAGRQGMRAVACAALESGAWIPSEVLDADLEPALWLRGPDVVRHALDTKRDRRTRESAAFPQGGYFVLSHAGAHAVVDCGELGYLSIAAHGHADCLSLCYGTSGRWLLVDPGTFCYHRSRDWRDHFRSTGAHNTVAIDARNQSEMIGPFMWGARARARQKTWCASLMGDVFEGTHDGYSAVGVSHSRTVALLANGACVIVDRLDGRGRHTLSTGFQLAVGVSAAESASSTKKLRGFVIEDGHGGTATLHASVPDGLSCGVVRGDEDPKAGWVSRGFGERSPAPRVQFSGDVELPALLVTVLVAGGAGGGSSVHVEAGDREGVSVSVGAGARRQRFLAGRVRLEKLRFDGAFGISIEDASGASGSSNALGAVGFDIREWTNDGEPVDFEETVNRL